MRWQCGNELSDVSLFALPFRFALSVSSVESVLSFSRSVDRSSACKTKHCHPSQLPLRHSGDLALVGTADSSSFCPSVRLLQATPARRPKRKQEDKKRKEDTDIKALPPGFL
ncbi:hypothetical protein QQF64_010486 [Cirrhinus molitorella]